MSYLGRHEELALSVVIPAYNEAVRLSQSLPRIRGFFDSRQMRYEIIVVDDGSEDSTAAVVHELGADDPKISVVRLPTNRGKGAAVRAGVMRALGKWVLIADADQSSPISEFDHLAAALEAGADGAIGSRGLPESILRPAARWSRRTAGQLFNAIVRTLGLSSDRDTQCGFKLFTRNAVASVLNDCRVDRFAFDVELLALMRRAGFDVREVPITWRSDPETRVRLGIDGPRMLIDVGGLWARLLTQTQHLEISLLLGIAAILVLRFLGLGMLPIADPSESRYFSLAITMLESADWLIPRFPDGTPFWGKPPLHFWLMATSMASFGATEFAARLPSAAMSGVLMLLTYAVAVRAYDRVTGMLAVAFLATSVFAFGYSALTLTDLTLACAIGASLTAFYIACVVDAHDRRRLAGSLLFAALGAGMLTKGPVAIAIFGMAVMLWSLLERNFEWRREIPWGIGVLVFSAVALPWFVAAEARTPGFLEYFFIHENFLRFVTTDYGDLYGGPHEAYPGSVFGYVVVGFLPWSLLLAGLATRMSASEVCSERSGRFLIAWALAAPVFFMASRNVVLSYALPSLPALSILTARLVATRDPALEAKPREWGKSLRRDQRAILVTIALALALLIMTECWERIGEYGISAMDAAWVLGLLGLVGSWWAWSAGRSVRATAAALAVVLAVAEFAGRSILQAPMAMLSSTAHLGVELRTHPELSACEILFYSRIPHSAQFYLGGRLESVRRDGEEVQRHLRDGSCHVLVVRKDRDLRALAHDGDGKPICEHGRYRAYWFPADSRKSPQRVMSNVFIS